MRRSANSGAIRFCSTFLTVSALLASQSFSAVVATTTEPISLTASSKKAEKPAYAGIVKSLTGKWTVTDTNGKTVRVKAGDSLPYGGVLQFHTKGATISGQFIDRSTFSYPEQPDVVGKPLRPLDSEPDKRPWWAALLGIMIAPGGTGISPIVRTARYAAILQDAVTPLDGETLEVSRIFVDSESDDQRFVVVEKLPIGCEVSESDKSGPLEIKFDSSGSARITLKGVTDGVYQVTLCDDSPEHKRTDETCWLFVIGQDEFEHSFNEFNNAREELKQWSEVPYAVKVRLLRALMVSYMVPLCDNSSSEQ